MTQHISQPRIVLLMSNRLTLKHKKWQRCQSQFLRPAGLAGPDQYLWAGHSTSSHSAGSSRLWSLHSTGALWDFWQWDTPKSTGLKLPFSSIFPIRIAINPGATDAAGPRRRRKPCRSCGMQCDSSTKRGSGKRKPKQLRSKRWRMGFGWDLYVWK